MGKFGNVFLGERQQTSADHVKRRARFEGVEAEHGAKDVTLKDGRCMVAVVAVVAWPGVVGFWSGAGGCGAGGGGGCGAGG